MGDLTPISLATGTGRGRYYVEPALVRRYHKMKPFGSRNSKNVSYSEEPGFMEQVKGIGFDTLAGLGYGGLATLDGIMRDAQIRMGLQRDHKYSPFPVEDRMVDGEDMRLALQGRNTTPKQLYPNKFHQIAATRAGMMNSTNPAYWLANGMGAVAVPALLGYGLYRGMSMSAPRDPDNSPHPPLPSLSDKDDLPFSNVLQQSVPYIQLDAAEHMADVERRMSRNKNAMLARR